MPVTREQRRFSAIGRLLSWLSRPFSAWVDRFWARWIKPSAQISQDWLDDADWARIQQTPLRARTLLYAMFISLLLLLLWAALAPLDEVARGQGKVIPSLQTQVVQSFDGGVVQEVLVSEGQIVDKGDLLMRIDPTRFVSTFRENRAQYLSLQARAARLRALVDDTELVFPPDLALEDIQLEENERSLYQNNLLELAQQMGIVEQQLTQRREELNEIEARLAQATRAYELSTRELEVTRPLLGSGAISEVEILRLERDASNADGERKQAIAQKARIESSIAEAENRRRQVELEVKNQWRAELSETLAQLSSLSEAGTGLADRIKYADIYAPVRGTVQRLFVNTIGGVVQPGREVLEMIPLDDELLVEAKISPKDIAFVRPGQQAMVKLTAYDFTVYGGLMGELEHISADTITDEEDKQTYYLVRVRTQKVGFADNLPIMPGMTAQVDIITGKKTVLSYLLKPVLRAKQNALTER
ncbi:MAG TPA: HlyD family type I secretion periplasmic adaptor subunit [Cellvibrionaceae bacterium]